MKKRGLLMTIALMFIASLFLSACQKQHEGYVLLTGGTGGTYYPLGGQIAEIIEEETDLKVDMNSSNASADNVQDIADGEAELAFVQTDVVAYAVEGIHMFEEDGAVENIQAVASLFPETIQIVTTKDSGIESVEDLEGKAVSVGAPGSGTYINAEQILAVHGLDIESDIDAHDLTFDESTDGIQDGNIDAAFITAGTPTGSVVGLSATVDIDIVPIEQDKIDELIDMYPHYALDMIEGDNAEEYGLDGDVQTVAVLAMLAVADDVSEDDVYEITKTLFEQTDKMAHDKADFITLDTALDGIGIDLHPGAAKYYEEQGIDF